MLNTLKISSHLAYIAPKKSRGLLYRNVWHAQLSLIMVTIGSPVYTILILI